MAAGMRVLLKVRTLFYINLVDAPLRSYMHNFVNHTQQEYAYEEEHENYEKLSS
jgi:hypothetical protein